MKRLSFWMVITLIALMVPVSVFGGPSRWNEDEDDDDKKYRWKRWKHQYNDFFDGFGGFIFSCQMISSSDLDKLAGDLNVDPLDEGVLTFGGYGMGNVGRGWYIGGGGFGGGATTSGISIRTDDAGQEEKYTNEIKMEFGGGGFMFEWMPLSFGPVTFGAGSMLGGGGVTIEVSRCTGGLDWDNLTEPFRPVNVDADNAENHVINVSKGFFMAQPYIAAHVRLLEWMALSGAAGYNLTSMSVSGWEFSDKELDGDGPDMDINDPFFRFGILFGG